MAPSQAQLKHENACNVVIGLHVHGLDARIPRNLKENAAAMRSHAQINVTQARHQAK
jgi:hypothetical protein